MKFTFVLSVWLALAGSAFSAQTATDAGAKSEKTAKVSLSPKFRSLAEDTFDAVDRLWGETGMSDAIFESAKLEAERLFQKLQRAAVRPDEKKVCEAVGRYFGQIQLCRIVGPTSATAYHADCPRKEREARTSALRSLGRETPRPASTK
jgi:hypothetical protein